MITKRKRYLLGFSHPQQRCCSRCHTATLPLCFILCELIIFASANNFDYTHNKHGFLRRKVMYLPPAPVTPFRGGLKSSVSTTRDNKDNDEEDSINGIKSSRDESGNHSIEANSSDSHHIITGGGKDEDAAGASFSRHSLISPSKVSATPWAPEDYPDPWSDPILCGGAATASLLNEEQVDSSHQQLTDLGLGKTPSPQQNTSQMRRPLFCDPDQVLDKETLRALAIKLREFAEAFALSGGVTEGVDFGGGGSRSESNSRDSTDELIELLNGDLQASGDDISQGEDTQESNADSMPPDDEVEDVEDRAEALPPTNLAQRAYFQPALHPVRRQLGTSNAMMIPEEMQLYSDSVGGPFSTSHRDKKKNEKKKESIEDTNDEVAIALVQKINLPAILRSDSYFFYNDQDDMVNDAAQYFARYIHDTWSKHLSQEQKASDNGDASSTPTNIVLIFISTQDRICYISSGARVASILPWWRLEHVVENMKQDLRKGNTGSALNIAIEDLTGLLLQGPPTLKDRVDDFFLRFGVVMLFTAFTFVFATWGECSDRRKRLFFVERRSRMTAAEKEKARLLQKEFRSKMCPICLEPFDLVEKEPAIESTETDKEQHVSDNANQKLARVDSYGIPLIGSDDKPIKMLRCGHLFDKTCWEMWTDSGTGNPCICPVCRQDVGRPKRRAAQRSLYDENEDSQTGEDAPNREQSSLFTRIVTVGPSMLLGNHHQPNYNTIQQRTATRNDVTPFAPLSHPTLRRLHPMFGLSATPPIEQMEDQGLGEHTPLFAQTSNSTVVFDDEDDY